MEIANKLRLIFLISFAILIPILQAAEILDFDQVWRKRADKALQTTKESFVPNPETITTEFNKFTTLEMNTTRRNLIAGGSCEATNAIDQCWRCKANWADDRMKLAQCALGFGRNTAGGKGGKIYLVTDSSDNDVVNPKPGTLRHAVIQKEPLWITFDKNMNIKLSQELIITSDKTIDGRGAEVHIASGAGITIQFVKNIIIHGIHIHNIIPRSGGMIRDSVDHFGRRGASEGDGISIFGSSNIWLDHLTMSQCADGLIDAVQGSTAITISNCHFSKHNHVILLGAQDSYTPDKMMQVTIAFNRFDKGLVQRMPRCRLGFFHVVNNDYNEWEMYAIGGSKNPTIISQGNRFFAPQNGRAKEVTKREAAPDEWKQWTWISQKDLFLNGAFFNQASDPKQLSKFSGHNLMYAKPGEEVLSLTKHAGVLSCRPGSPC